MSKSKEGGLRRQTFR